MRSYTGASIKAPERGDIYRLFEIFSISGDSREALEKGDLDSMYRIGSRVCREYRLQWTCYEYGDRAGRGGGFSGCFMFHSFRFLPDRTWFLRSEMIRPV